MKTIFRITKPMLDEIREDLTRPHPVAYERIGFIYVRLGTVNNGRLLLATDYKPVRDEHYIKPAAGDFAGAVINRYAITEVMQGSLSTGHGVFHVHMHDFGTKGIFSGTDLASLNELMPSFYSVSRDTLHGAVLLTRKNITGLYWSQGESAKKLSHISEVGYPYIKHGGNTK